MIRILLIYFITNLYVSKKKQSKLYINKTTYITHHKLVLLTKNKILIK